ncbi:unnamed protein product [Pleuronectes platessa]|uniref:Dual specificity phosphatase 16 n=1 Tax=Pleuronectes platessa TaxID=8262 RepID=A0A9N7Y6M3_PLEPL|nr:unnamed protein product [Pleuronectes platessa]
MLRPSAVRPIGAEALVALLEGGLDRVVLIDSRPFVDFNVSHILEAVNVNCSKLMKRRLQQDKVQIAELLQHSAKKKLELQGDQEVVVYDQSSSDPTSLGSDSFLSVLLVKLERSFPSVHLLSGGFSEFSHLFPGLCEGKSSLVPSCVSQPCLLVNNIGPTRILPHLYLGCQRDVLNQELMQQNQIVYVLNASNTCPKPDFVPDSHFLRVPVNDSFCEKILPWLDRSVEFIEKAKASDARVLVHCLAGISRSATIAIAYIMKRMDMPLDEAYRFVKEKRSTISPNFNFLGQLLDFEKKIKSPHGAETKLKSLLPQEPSAPPPPDDLESALSPEVAVAPGPAPLEAPPLPCALAEALSGLQLADGPEDNARLKRSFSLDIKSFGEVGGAAAHRVFAPHAAAGDATDFYKPPSFKETTSKPCQFSPVEEVSEQSTPEQSPDKEEADGAERLEPPASSTLAAPAAPAPAAPAAQNCSQQLHRSGSTENATSFLFGLSHSLQHLAHPGSGGALKGWHSDILLGPVTVSTSSLTGGWYLSSDSSRFYSTSILSGGGGFAAYSCSHGLEAVRRRSRQRMGDRCDSRRSWHEESSFEKQLKRRSCQMEFGDGRTDSRSPEEMVKVGSQSSFSGSMEVIEEAPYGRQIHLNTRAGRLTDIKRSARLFIDRVSEEEEDEDEDEEEPADLIQFLVGHMTNGAVFLNGLRDAAVSSHCCRFNSCSEFSPNRVSHRRERVRFTTDRRERVRFTTDRREGVRFTTDRRESPVHHRPERERVRFTTDRRERVRFITDRRERVRFTTDRRERVRFTDRRERVRFTTDRRERVQFTIDRRERVRFTTDRRERVRFTTDRREGVRFTTDRRESPVHHRPERESPVHRRERVRFTTDRRERVQFITDRRERVRFTTDRRERVRFITDRRERVRYTTDRRERVQFTIDRREESGSPPTGERVRFTEERERESGRAEPRDHVTRRLLIEKQVAGFCGSDEGRTRTSGLDPSLSLCENLEPSELLKDSELEAEKFSFLWILL